MSVKKGNVALTLSVDPKVLKELKKKSVIAGMTISAFMCKAASDVDPYFVFKTKQDKNSSEPRLK